MVPKNINHFKHRSKNIDVTFYSRYGMGEWGGTRYQVQNLISWTSKKTCCAETVGEEQGIEIGTPHCWRRDGQYQVQNLISWTFKKNVARRRSEKSKELKLKHRIAGGETASTKFKILYPELSKKMLRGDGRRRARNWNWNTVLLEERRPVSSSKF